MNGTTIPPCDPKYIEALGLAVHHFAWLEHSVIWIIEQLEPNYWRDYVSNEKTAGAVASDLDRAIEKHAKGHATEAGLRDISEEFRRLKYLRDKLLHATPAVGPDGRRLHHIARDMAWSLDEVRKAATDFAAAAESAHAMFRRL